jgi:hypothetical protein
MQFCCVCGRGSLLAINADCTLNCNGHNAALTNNCCKIVVSQWNMITGNLNIELAFLVNMVTLG